MKKLCVLLVLVMLASALPVMAESAAWGEAPLLAERVSAGTLPPVEERLPQTPKLTNEILAEYLDMQVGDYGGTLRLISPDVNWDPDAFIGMNEAILTMRSANSGEIEPNIVEDFQVNDDNTVFTFTLRSGLKWSDGVEVTMEDFRFGIENFVFNAELTPVVATYMRDAGVATGDPFVFKIIDENTFTITFKQSYGGFAVHLSIGGWKGYTDILKPAHYLKPFHIDYAEEIHGSLEAYYEYIAPFAAIIGYDDPTEESVWTYVFNGIDMTNWELSDPVDALTTVRFPGLIDANIPVLYGWLMIDSAGGITTWERNPYYFKVDEAGNQLPYIDYISSKHVETMELAQLSYISGEGDFGRENATLDNLTLYKESEASANITAYVTEMHVVPTDILINMTYGLDLDGNVKDDDASKAWQEVINDIRFRQALMLSIDAEEILETVYLNMGETNPSYDCIYDIDGANALLDEMGMADINGDGYRETPSGLALTWQIWNANEASDILPVVELLVEFFSEIGLHVTGYTTDSSILSASRSANEIPMRCAWTTTTALWHYDTHWSAAEWGTLWNTWWTKDGANGLEPPQDVKDFYLLGESLFTVAPADAVDVVLPAMDEWMSSHIYIIQPLTDVQQCVIINSDIGNVPTGGAGIGWNFSFEQFYYAAK